VSAGGGIAHPRRALANIAAKGGSIAIERGAQLAIMLVAAPVLGPAAFGRFAFAASVGGLLSFGADLGLSLWTTRTLARDPSLGGVVFGTAMRLRLVAAVPVSLALIAISAVVDDDGLRVAVPALGVAMLLRVFVDQARAVFRAHERLGDEAQVNSITAIAAAAAGIFGLLLDRAGAGGGLAGLSIGMMVGTLVGAAYGFGLLARRYRSPEEPPRQIAIDVRALRARMLRESLPFWFAGILSLIYARGDVLVLRALASDAEVGAYRTAGHLVEVARQVAVMLLTALFAQLARAFAEDRTQNRQRLLRLERQVSGLLLAAGLVAGVALAGLAQPLVPRLFGPAFARTIPALWVLSAAVPLMFLNAGLLHFFAARDRGSLNLLFSGLMVPVNLIANLLLDRRFGAVGAALATLVGEALLSAGCLYALAALRREDRAPAVSARRAG
jgi:O-antigen/teichoic acid export membrane protein